MIVDEDADANEWGWGVLVQNWMLRKIEKCQILSWENENQVDSVRGLQTTLVAISAIFPTPSGRPGCTVLC